MAPACVKQHLYALYAPSDAVAKGDKPLPELLALFSCCTFPGKGAAGHAFVLPACASARGATTIGSPRKSDTAGQYMQLVLQDSDADGFVRNAPPLTRGHKESGTRKLRSGAVLPNEGALCLTHTIM